MADILRFRPHRDQDAEDLALVARAIIAGMNKGGLYAILAGSLANERLRCRGWTDDRIKQAVLQRTGVLPEGV